jgi:hypothetical protein
MLIALSSANVGEGCETHASASVYLADGAMVLSKCKSHSQFPQTPTSSRNIEIIVG